MRRLRALLVALAVVGALLMAAPRALAACHAFTVSANPAEVAEGGKVTVTVSRDAGLNPSQVDVSSVDVTATAGEDYPAVKRTISFATETQQSFELAVTDDSAAEGDETFKLHLSNPGGCAINPNFQLGPDATVTIPHNDASGTTPPPTAAPTTRPPAMTTTSHGARTTPTSADPNPSAPGSETTSSTAANTATSPLGEADQTLPATEDDGGSGVGLAIAAVVAIVALGAAGYFLYRRRGTAGRRT